MFHQTVRFIVFAIATTASFCFADEGHEHQHHGTGAGFGKVDFSISCGKNAQSEFERGLALMHSFWYEESDKAFAALARKYPQCAMAQWGIAMSAWHQLWSPAQGTDLERGAAAAQKGQKLAVRATPRERDYIAAINAYYKDAPKTPHKLRAQAYAKAMEGVYQRHPEDLEAGIFYALALNAIVDPSDKTYSNQKIAGPILEKIFSEQPQHPGVAHYLIHNYDYTMLAPMGLDAARRYASIAPAVPHALHMPSHIFTRVGQWEDSINSNRAAKQASIDYATRNHLQSAIDEQFHAMDYLTYAYLQSGQYSAAKRERDELTRVKGPSTQKAEFALTAIGARCAIEMRDWKSAAELSMPPTSYKGLGTMVHLARALGAAHQGDFPRAQAAIAELESLRKELEAQDEPYWAGQAETQRLEAAGWLAHAQGADKEAARLLRQAADMEDRTDKLNVTPGAIVPARELLADFLMEAKQPAVALEEYEKSLETAPRRFNGLYGAARAAVAAGDSVAARRFYAQLLEVAPKADSELAQIAEAKEYVAQQAAAVAP